MNKFDPHKPVQTRIGQPVTIVYWNGRGLYPLLGYIGNSKTITGWSENGTYNYAAGAGGFDLVNIPVKSELWVNIYGDDVEYGYSTRKAADCNARPSRIACVRVEYTEGEGL